MKPRKIILAWTISLVVFTLLLSSLFVSSAQTGVVTNSVQVNPQPVATPTPLAPPVVHHPYDEPDEDVDSGPRGRGNMSFKDYLMRREQMINKLHGLPFTVPGNPRINAIRLLKQQEAALHGSTSPAGSGGSSGGGSSSPSAPAVGPTWASIGPAPIPDGQTNLIDATRNPVSGRVLTIAVHPTNPNIAYVGTAQGGLYRTLNGGLTWTPLMDDALTLAVGAVTIDPLDPTTLFVGTGEGNFCGDCFFGVGFYIIKNADSSTPTLLGPYNTATNTPNGLLANSRSITKIVVNPSNDNTIFIGTGSGVGGINGGAGAGQNLSPRGLFRCENVMSGTPSCTKLNLGGAGGGPNTAVRDMVLEPGNANNLIIGVEDPVASSTNGVWRSTNALAATPGAITFTRTLVTADFTNVTLAIHKTGSAVTVYAATEDDADGNGGTTGVVRKSTDGGVTFPTVLASSRGFCGGQCFYDMAIAVDPNDVNNVFIGGGGDYDATQTACKVTTDGVNFVKKAAGLHPDVHAIAIAPSNTNIIYHGNDGGIFKSTNDGNNWTSMNTAGFNATQFVSLAQHPTDRNFMIGGTQDNGTPYLRANNTWKLGQFGDGGYALIDRNATDTGATVTAYHTFYNAQAAQIGFERADGASQIDTSGWPTFYGCGVTIFQPNGISCADFTLFYSPMALGPGNPNTIYFGTDKIYRSSDKGVTMPVASQVFETNTPTPPATPTNTTVSAIGISPQNDNVRVVGISSGKVFATTTGSSVMTDVTPPVTPRKFIGRAVVDPGNAMIAYVTLVGYGVPNGQHIWKTANLSTATGASPVTWTAAGNGIPDVPVDALAIDPQNTNTLYAGTDIGVYTSTDGGANWVPYGTGLPRVAVFDMAILDSFRILRVATHGRGIWEIPIPGATLPSAPTFFGADHVDDLHDGSRLQVSWLPAASLNPTANIVYDIYRVPHVTHGDSTQDPTFTPNAGNKIATGVLGTSYTDTGLTLAQPYYYIVQARDTSGGGLDTNGTGNRVVKFSAPTSPQVTLTPPFALENFEAASADSRFTPPLNEATANPNQALASLQRITVANLGTPGVGKLYAPEFSPGDEADGCSNDPAGTRCGGQSDFFTQIGPINGLTPTSIMEFDNAINAEAGFDGGVVEIKVGAPFVAGDATPFPDNTTTWDLGDYLIEGYYNGRLDGALPAGGGGGSSLQGRRAYSGIKGPHHVRADLRNFSPGGLHNPSSLPVYIRFRMTSDVATANGVDAGWFVDNLVINNLAPAACTATNVALASNGSTASASSTTTVRDYSPANAINGDRIGANWETGGGGWNDETRDVFPDSLEVDFSGPRTINEIRVYTVQNDYRNPVEPDVNTPADVYGILDFDVQYWDGTGWLTVPNGSVTGNDKAMRVFTFADIATTKIRVVVNNSRVHFSRIVELEAFGCP